MAFMYGVYCLSSSLCCVPFFACFKVEGVWYFNPLYAVQSDSTMPTSEVPQNTLRSSLDAVLRPCNQWPSLNTVFSGARLFHQPCVSSNTVYQWWDVWGSTVKVNLIGSGAGFKVLVFLIYLVNLNILVYISFGSSLSPRLLFTCSQSKCKG